MKIIIKKKYMTNQIKQDRHKRFDETKFAKEGGSCFECCDYEEMYIGLKQFLDDEIKAEREIIRDDIKVVLIMLGAVEGTEKIIKYINKYLK